MRHEERRKRTLVFASRLRAWKKGKLEKGKGGGGNVLDRVPFDSEAAEKGTEEEEERRREHACAKVEGKTGRCLIHQGRHKMTRPRRSVHANTFRNKQGHGDKRGGRARISLFGQGEAGDCKASRRVSGKDMSSQRRCGCELVRG